MGQTELALVIRNVSDRPVRYLVGEPTLPRRLILMLFNEENRRTARETVNFPLLEGLVDEIAPGEHLVSRFEVPGAWVRVQPGRYRLEGRMRGQPNPFDLTQFHLHRSLFYVLVSEDAVDPPLVVREPLELNRDILPRQIEPPVSVLPIMRFPQESAMELVLLFEHTGGVTIRYLSERDGWPRYLELVLLKDGQVQRPLQERLHVDEADLPIRELKEEQIIRRLSLRERYGDLEPGVYLLEARMEGQPHGRDLTQIFLHRPVMYIQITEDE